MLLENRIAIVTGGARGIGAATVSLFRSEGARVEVWDTGGEHPEAAGDEGLICRKVDVSDADAVEADQNITDLQPGALGARVRDGVHDVL